ncbi:MAG: PEP-CTERM sorting domain-containing protein [Pirellulales bacterium]
MNLVESSPQEAFAGLARFDLGPGSLGADYVGYDMLLVYNSKGTPLSNPMLGIGEEDYLVPLVEGGYSNDIMFGGSGDTAVTNMDGFSIYATLIPEDAEWFNLSVDSGGIILSEKQQILNNGELMFVTSSPDVPVLDATWTAANGNWSSAANWSLAFNETGLPPDGTEDPVVPGVPTNSAAYAFNIHIQNSATVDADIIVTVDQLNIGADDSLVITDGKSLTVERFAVRTDSGRIANDGEILIDGSLGSTTQLFLSGPGLMLDGTGVLKTTASPDNVISGLRNSDLLTQFADHTIEAAGMLGDNRLVMTNHGRITTFTPTELAGHGELVIDPTGDALRNSPAVVNHGTIDVDSDNNFSTSPLRTLTLRDGFFANEAGGLIEARGDGHLVFDDVRIHNDGTIRVDATSWLSITGNVMLTGNDLSLEDMQSFVEIQDANFVNATQLVGQVFIANSNVLNAGGKLGGRLNGENAFTELFDSTLTGGELDGRIFFGGSTLKDATLLPDAEFDGSGMGLAGRIENRAGVGMGANGPAQGFFSAGGAQVVEDATLTGEGFYEVFSFDGSFDPQNPTTLTISAEATVQFADYMANDLIIINEGSLTSADVSSIDPAGDQSSSVAGLRNSGVIRISSESEFYDGVYDNTGGLIDVTVGSFYNVTLVGGTLQGDTWWAEREFSGGLADPNHVIGTVFTKDAAPGTPEYDQFLQIDHHTVLEEVTFTRPTHLSGAGGVGPQIILRNSLNLTDTGSLTFQTVDITFDNDFSFEGEGTLYLEDANLSGSTPDVRLTIGEQFTLDASQTINWSQYGQNSLIIENRGSIDDAGMGAEITLDPTGDLDSAEPGLINRGAIRVGILYLNDAYVDNRGGHIGGPSSATLLAGVRVVGGTLENFEIYDSQQDPESYFNPQSRLENVTLEGSGYIEGVDLALVGTIENNALVEVSNATLTLDGPVRLTGAVVEFTEGTTLVALGEDDTLTNEAGHTLRVTGFDDALQGYGVPQIINYGTLITELLDMHPVFTTEVLPAGTEVPDVSDPNNPDATMLLTEETTYEILRPLINTGVIEAGEIYLNQTAIENSGTLTGVIASYDSTILNVGGRIEGNSLDMLGNSALIGGSAEGVFITVNSFADERAIISEVNLLGSSIQVTGPMEFGGNVLELDYLEVSAPLGTEPVVFIENDATRLETADTFMASGTINLAAGAFRTDTISFGGAYDFLDWTGGTFGLMQQDMTVGSTGLLGDAIDLPAGFGLEVGQNLSIASDGQVTLSGGSLYVGTLSLASPASIHWTGGTLGLTSQDLHVTAGGTLGSGVTLTAGYELDVHQSLNVADDGAVLLGGGTLRAGTINHTAGGALSFSSGTLDVETFNGNLTQLGGTLAPGNSLGVTQVTGNYALDGGTIAIELAGLVQGDEFDFVEVLGNFDIANGALDVSLIDDFVLGAGQQFEIIAVGGTQTGVFSDLPEGELVGNFNGLDLFVTYQAGDGNDIALFTNLEGDFNGNGIVDAADYTVWRDGLGGAFDQQDYGQWKQNFGATSGATGSASEHTAVPEPATLGLLMLAIFGMLLSRDHRVLMNRIA